MTVKEFRDLFNTYVEENNIIDEYTEELFDIYSSEISEWLQEVRFNFENDKVSIIHFDSEYGDGDGSDIYEVYEVTNKETNEKEYFKFSGYRSSWDSSYFDSLRKVIPQSYTAYTYKSI